MYFFTKKERQEAPETRPKETAGNLWLYEKWATGSWGAAPPLLLSTTGLFFHL